MDVDDILQWTPPSDIGSVSPSAVEKEFQIDLTKKTYIPQCSPSYHKLSSNQVDTFEQGVSDDHGGDGTQYVVNLLRDMKRASSEPQTSQSYELLVKQSLDAIGPVRGGGEEAMEPLDGSTEVIQQYYRLSQAILRNEFTASTIIHRGLRVEDASRLAVDIIEDPNKGGIILESSVVSNYTISQEVAKRWAEGLVVDFGLGDNLVAVANDYIYSYSDIRPEGEVHLLSGKVLFHPESIKMVGKSDTHLAMQTVKQLTRPETLTDDQHWAVLELVDVAGESGRKIECRDGVIRLKTWLEHIQDNNVFPKGGLEVASEAIDILID